MSAVDRLIRAGGVQGSASAHLSAVICGSASDGAATIGNACACLNAGFSRAFLSNLFIIWSRFNNPAGRQIVSRKFRRNSVPGCLPFLGLNAIGTMLWRHPDTVALKSGNSERWLRRNPEQRGEKREGRTFVRPPHENKALGFFL